MENDIVLILKGVSIGLVILSPLLIFILVKQAARYIVNKLKNERLSRSGIWEIDRMDGKTFEKYLAALFTKLGYKVERTKYVGDYGADLVVKKDSVKTIIQAKRYKNKVGIKAIQEAVAAKGYYKCHDALVITNSFYTKPAVNLAKANQVKLWDRNDLIKALLSISGR